MVIVKNNKYQILQNKSSIKKLGFLYIANDNDFIIQSILFSINSLVKTNKEIGTIYILEDFKDKIHLEKCIRLWKSEYQTIKTINIQDIIDNFGIGKLYRDKYKNRYDVVYDEIVNAKMLLPLFVDKLDEDLIMYIDSDMEIKADLSLLKKYVKDDICLYGILERDHIDNHENQDVVSKKLANNGYNFTYEEKTGSFEYLNTGILMYNIPYFKKIPLEKRVDFIRECFEMKVKCKFDFPEQDCMNVMWSKKCIPLYDYNVFSYKKDQLEDAKVIHYIWAGDGKKELKEKIYDYMYRKMIG